MKTKIKRHGRSVISVILAVCLLISCMTVGLIATDAAKVTDSAVGAKDNSEALGNWSENGKDWAAIYANWDASTGKSSSWGQHSPNMTWNDSEKQFEHTYTMRSGQYFEFKILSNNYGSSGKWYGQNSMDDWISGSADSNAGLTENGNNIPMWTMNSDTGLVSVKIMAKPSDNRVYVHQSTTGTAKNLKLSGNFGDGLGDDQLNWQDYNSTSWSMTNNGNGTCTYTLENLDSKTIDFYQFAVLDSSSSSWHRDESFKSTSTISTDTDTYITDQAMFDDNGNVTAKFKLSSAANVTITYDFVDGWVKINAAVADVVKYYVVGMFENGESFFGVNAWATDTSKNELTGDGTTKSITFTEGIYQGTYSYKVVKVTNDDATTEVWYPAGDGNNKEIEVNENCQSLTFTFDTSTETPSASATYPSTPTPSGSWVAGDKYTSTGAQNSNQKVADTPAIGSTSTDWKYVWAKQSENVGRDNSNCPTIGLVKNDGNGYWADVTTQVKACTDTNSNFYFALSDSGNNSGIKGDKNEKINTIKNSKGKENKVVMYTSDGSMAFTVEMTDHGQVTNNANFPLIYGVDWTKITNIGVMAYYSGSGAVDYQFYFKEAAAPPTPTGPKLVKIYAKNGSLRDATYNRFTKLADTQIDTTITYPEGYTPEEGSKAAVTHNVAYGDSNYDYAVNVPVGSTITLTTQLKTSRDATLDFGDNFADTHYLKAYSMNGKTYKVFTPSDGVNGLYTQTWTIPEDWEDDYVEITPIYYMQDSSLTKTFYIEGYSGNVQSNWGNLLSVYPYYENKKDKDNAFGGYPGQPMLYWGGKYQMEIPLTVDGSISGAQVKGLTLHNSYWDLLHRGLDAKCKTGHRQTYDYDDFYKLYKEKNPDTIYFWFKFRDSHDNFAGTGEKEASTKELWNESDYKVYDFADNNQTLTYDTVKSWNGAELVTDYYGREVDVFGNLIDTNDNQYTTFKSSTDDVNNTLKGNELLFVSTGYRDTYVGEYATIWAVYNQTSQNNFSLLGYISSSMLYLNKIDNRLNYDGGDSTADGKMSDSRFVNTYNTLAASYNGVPAIISYEKDIFNNSKDKANRSDGKWFYSNGKDKIQANIEIQYANTTSVPALNSESWRTESAYVAGYLGESNTGEYTGCSAYFTNTTPNIIGKRASGEVLVDNNKYFTFQAKADGKWVFAGWVRRNSQGELDSIESENGLGHSNISANDTYISRFVKASSGSLVVSHNIEQTTISGVNYFGTGTPSITATLCDDVAGNTATAGVEARTVTDGSDISLNDWMANNTYVQNKYVKITLSTEEDEDCTWHDTVSKTKGYDITVNSKNATSAVYKLSDIADAGTTAIRFVTHLTKTVYTYNYEITYNYTSRFWGEQSYKVTDTVPSELVASSYFSGKKATAKLLPSFIESKTPFEKNIRQSINWNYTESPITLSNNKTVQAMVNNYATVSGTTCTMTATVYSGNIVDDVAHGEFKLPYAFNRDGDMSATKSTTFASSDTTTSNGTEIIFSEADFASKTVDTQYYKLFQYDNSISEGGEGSLVYDYNLVVAAPYVYKNAAKHYTTAYGTRTMSGTWTANQLTAAGYVQSNETGTSYTYYDDEHVSHTATSVIYYKGKSGDNFDGKIEYFEHRGNYYLTTPYQKMDGYTLAGATKYYFTRWDVYTTDMRYVASSYHTHFNLSAYEDYIIIPIYESTEPVTANSSSTETSASITYLGDSRNQWNNDGAGNYQQVTKYTDAIHKGDKLFADFGLSFEHNGEKLYSMKNKAEGGKDVKIGIVIERLKEVESVAGVVQTEGTYYANKYKETYATDQPNLEDYIKYKMGVAGGSNTRSDNVKGRNYYAIGSNVDGFGAKFNTNQAAGSTTDLLGFTQVIDNYNRLQFFHTITKLNDNALQTDQSGFAFRAIAFIDIDGTLTLSDPVYFTVYDSANR